MHVDVLRSAPCEIKGLCFTRRNMCWPFKHLMLFMAEDYCVEDKMGSSKRLWF